MKVGDKVWVALPDGNEWLCEVTKIHDDRSITVYREFLGTVRVPLTIVDEESE